ncbi:unnamed protein product [Discosporangium mesarthrocarpum]
MFGRPSRSGDRNSPQRSIACCGGRAQNELLLASTTSFTLRKGRVILRARLVKHPSTARSLSSTGARRQEKKRNPGQTSTHVIFGWLNFRAVLSLARWEECPHFLSPSGSPPSTCPCAISGCGWPAFDKCFKGAVVTKTDNAYGMRRVEIMCGNCGGHLGHVFEGERMTSTNERHCVNSVSVKFNPGTIPEGLEEDTVVYC